MQQLRIQFFLVKGSTQPSEQPAASLLEISRAGATPSRAVAYIEGYSPDQRLQANVDYILCAGVVGDELSIPESHSMPLPSDFVATQTGGATLTFDVVVRAEDMEVLPKHHQVYVFVPYQSPDLSRFTIIPKATGRKTIIVEFYHERRWLQAITLEVDVDDQPKLH